MKTFCFVLASLTLIACGGGDPVGPQAQTAGTYALVQVNGATVPANIFQNSAGRVEVVSGTMVLRADGSYTETRNSRIVYNSGGTENSTVVENGTYSVTGSQITFSIPASGSLGPLSYTGAISPGVVTYTWNSNAYRYTR